MNDPELWLIAINAFAAVLVVLAALALVVGALTRVFRATPAGRAAPGRSTAAAREQRAGETESADAAVLAALQAAVGQALPGGRVTRVVPLDDAAKGPP